MRAIVMRAGQLLVSEVPEPRLGPGQLLVEPIATGICGSDLSVREHTSGFLEGHLLAGAEHSLFDPGRDLVLGHEFTSRVLEVGEGVEEYAVGDELVTLPHVVDSRGVARTVGYSNEYPGGLAERVVVQAGGHLKLPAGVSPQLAAVTEPMATGLNGVLRSNIGATSGAIVIGAGPVGLGAIVELAHRGVHPIVASDPSPLRRAVAKKLGADLIIDPLQADPVTAWRDIADPGQPLYVYEASGRAGMLDTLFHTTPPYTRITVVGTCMESDAIRPLVAMLKNVAIEFVTGPGRTDIGYPALAAMLDHIAQGHFDAGQVVTGYTGLEGVPAVFDLLRPGDPTSIEHVKVLVRNDISGSTIRSA